MDEAEANAKKRVVDYFASDYIDIDWGGVKRHARHIADLLDKEEGPLTLAICGAAGSQKTTLSDELSCLCGEPAFDLDEFIPGGYTPNRHEYESRLWKGWDRLAQHLPRSGWIIEHVEAANPFFLKMFSPHFLLHIDPGTEFLSMVARARSLASNSTDTYRRETRARESRAISASQFKDAEGEIIRASGIWTLKKMGQA